MHSPRCRAMPTKRWAVGTARSARIVCGIHSLASRSDRNCQPNHAALFHTPPMTSSSSAGGADRSSSSGRSMRTETLGARGRGEVLERALPLRHRRERRAVDAVLLLEAWEEVLLQNLLAVVQRDDLARRFGPQVVDKAAEAAELRIVGKAGDGALDDVPELLGRVRRVVDLGRGAVVGRVRGEATSGTRSGAATPQAAVRGSPRRVISIPRSTRFATPISALLPSLSAHWPRRTRPVEELARRTRDVDDQTRRRSSSVRAQLHPTFGTPAARRARRTAADEAHVRSRCSSARCWRRRRSARRSASCSATTRCAPPCCTRGTSRCTRSRRRPPRARTGSRRCRAGAAAAAAQGHGAFWPAAMCCEAAVSSPPGAAPASGKLSCANRASVWASPSLGLHPHPLKAHGTAVRDVLGADTLMLFLPGTGTEPDQARALLEAASDMGYHVLGLSYAALPIAVSQMDLWCTRPGADAAACNAQLHEAVLYGKPTGDAAGGLWSVEKAESVEALAVAALHQLKWSQFVGGDNASVAWDRVVVSGHSQGASHAAYLSTTRKTRAAVLLSGPQECPAAPRGGCAAGRRRCAARRTACARSAETRRTIARATARNCTRGCRSETSRRRGWRPACSATRAATSSSTLRRSSSARGGRTTTASRWARRRPPASSRSGRRSSPRICRTCRPGACVACAVLITSTHALSARSVAASASAHLATASTRALAGRGASARAATVSSSLRTSAARAASSDAVALPVAAAAYCARGGARGVGAGAGAGATAAPPSSSAPAAPRRRRRAAGLGRVGGGDGGGRHLVEVLVGRHRELALVRRVLHQRHAAGDRAVVAEHLPPLEHQRRHRGAPLVRLLAVGRAPRLVGLRERRERVEVVVVRRRAPAPPVATAPPEAPPARTRRPPPRRPRRRRAPSRPCTCPRRSRTCARTPGAASAAPRPSPGNSRRASSSP